VRTVLHFGENYRITPMLNGFVTIRPAESAYAAFSVCRETLGHSPPGLTRFLPVIGATDRQRLDPPKGGPSSTPKPVTLHFRRNSLFVDLPVRHVRIRGVGQL
jgi:hypothetical protein